MTVGFVRDKRRQRIRTALTVAAAIALVTLVTLWLALEYKPGWYRPVTLDEAILRRASIESIALTERISDDLVHRRTVDVTLTDRTINEWLAALPELWPEAGNAFPKELSRPAVRFERGTVRLGAEYGSGGWRSILGVSLSIDVSSDGESLEAKLHGASSGSLPAPRWLLDRIIEPLLDGSRRPNDVTTANGDGGGEGKGEGGAVALRSVRSANDLFKGVTIRNRFVWFNGHRPFRIAMIDVGDGVIRLRLEPL